MILKKKSEPATQPKAVKKAVQHVETKPAFTDLRQVMDYTRPLTIFFSGVEYESYLDILYDLGIRNFLMSYEYLKGKGITQLKKYPDMHLFIDSGAFTYINDPKYEDYTVEQWEKQIHEYLNWARRHKESIFAICDLDLQYIVGADQVYEWRKKYFEPFMLETGIPVCFMYHEEGIDKWEYMCKRYPYVGLSMRVDADVDSTLPQMFKIADKYNTLVQGMASTNTQHLVKYPFYTVDSTTWNVGLKYGEISVWTGSKMSRIKKTEFQTKAFPMISHYDQKFDFDLILAEDKTEMIRVNAYAFIQAEKHIRERLKATMYWLKVKTKKLSLDDLPEDFYPSPDSLGDSSNFKEYAEKMNINPECDEAEDLVIGMTVFMNWDNPDYEEWKESYEKDPKFVESLHDMFVNRIVPDFQTKVNDLRDFFSQCLTGAKDTLLQLGTNFNLIVKDREQYLEEAETELVDISTVEIRNRLAGLLPSPSNTQDPAPDITELDDEIYRQADIVPVRDAEGKFLKGQTEVRKPKNLYSDLYPKMACDRCYASAKCAEYKPGYACAYNKLFKRFNTRNMADLIDAMQSMVGLNMERMQRVAIFEMLDGGVPQGTLTNFIDQNMRLVMALKGLHDQNTLEILRHTRVMRSDGTQEEMTQISNPQSGGVLERLFAASANPRPNTDDADVIEVPHKRGSMYEKKEEEFD